MTTKTDGGPAFPGKRPFKYYSMGEHKGVETVPGMSMRDWFAGLALQGICASGPGRGWSNALLAQEAYQLADAMLAARESKS